MWYLTACKILVILSFLRLNDFYHISELIQRLTLIQKYDNISFLIQIKTERLTKFYRLSDATSYDRVNTIYQFINPFLDKTCLFGKEYGAVNSLHIQLCT